MGMFMIAFVRRAPLGFMATGIGLVWGMFVPMIIVMCLLPSMSTLSSMLRRLISAIIKVCTLSGVMTSSGLLAVGLTTVTIVVASPLPHVMIAGFPMVLISASMLMTLFTAFGFLYMFMFVPRIAHAPLTVMIFLVDGPLVMAAFVLVAVGLIPIRSLRLGPIVGIMRRRIML